MPQGTIKTIVQDRGFGFIQTPDKDIFFHLTACDECDFEELEVGQAVEYELERNSAHAKGPRAKMVRVTSPAK